MGLLNSTAKMQQKSGIRVENAVYEAQTHRAPGIFSMFLKGVKNT